MIVGLAGMAGSGKDATADFLVNDFGFVKIALADPLKRVTREVYDFSEDQLWGPSEKRSEPDKRYPREHGPWTEDDKCLCCGVHWGVGAKGAQCYLTPRFALQTLGTEWGRGCYWDTWVDYAIRLAKKITVQQDGRLDLWDYDQRLGLIPWNGPRSVTGFTECPTRVVISDIRFRNELEATGSAGGELWRVTRPDHEAPKWNHQSETEQKGFKDEEFGAILRNTGTLESLHTLVTKLMQATEVLDGGRK